jgi:hypothetical protein
MPGALPVKPSDSSNPSTTQLGGENRGLQRHGADAQPGAALGVDSDGNAVGGVPGGWSCEFAATALLLGGACPISSRPADQSWRHGLPLAEAGQP